MKSMVLSVLMMLTFLQLSGASQAGAGFAPHSRSDDVLFEVANGLSLISFHVAEAAVGNPIALAVLDNQSDSAYENPYLLATLLDEDDDVIGEIIILTLAPEVPAHSLAPLFGASTSENEDALLTYSNVEFSFVSGKPNRIPEDRSTSSVLRVEVLNQDVTRSNSVETEVRVTNTGQDRVDDYDVVAMLLDGEGDMVGFGDQLTLSGLRPGQSAKVTVGWNPFFSPEFELNAIPDDYVTVVFAASS